MVISTYNPASCMARNTLPVLPSRKMCGFIIAKVQLFNVAVCGNCLLLPSPKNIPYSLSTLALFDDACTNAFQRLISTKFCHARTHFLAINSNTITLPLHKLAINSFVTFLPDNCANCNAWRSLNRTIFNDPKVKPSTQAVSKILPASEIAFE